MKVRNWKRAATLVVAVVAVGALFPGIGSTTLSPSTFEGNDGNLIAGQGGKDWNNIGINCAGTQTTPTVGCGIDLPTGQHDDSFGSGPANKEDGNPPPVTDGSIPNNKSDLTRFYVANEKVGGKDFLYLAWERVQDPNGTTNMDFEFNQSSTPSVNGVTPIRTAGDLLVKYDLSNGGVNPVLGYHRWITAASATTTQTPANTCEANNSFPCWDKVHGLTGDFEGAVNTVATTDTIRATGQTTDRVLSPRTFGEASVNLTDSGILGSGTCQTFGSAFLKSRSADSFTAAMKDYIAPIPITITNCGSVNIHKVDDLGGAMSGVTFTLWNNNAPVTTGTPGIEDTTATPTMACTTNGSGDCTISNVPFGNYWAVEGTPPNGYTAAIPQAFTIGPSQTTVSLTFTDNRQPASVTIHKVDDADPPVPLQGATFTLYVDNTPTGTVRGNEDTVTSPTLSCTTDAAGDCTISNILPAGNYWLHETTTPDGHASAADRAISLSLGQNLDISGTPFVDDRLFKVVTFVCRMTTTPTLYSTATVAYDGGSATSATATNTPGSGDFASAVEAAICGATGTYVHGASPGYIQKGSHSSSVWIR